MRFTIPAATALAAAALCAAPVAANAAVPSTPAPSSATPCATPGGFAKVQTGQTVAQVQQEMGSAGNTDDTTMQGGFKRQEITWRNCTNPIGSAGLVTYGVTFDKTPTTQLTVSSKTQLALGTLGG